MSGPDPHESSTIPAWRCKFPRCEQPLAFGSTTRCYYHRKLDTLPGIEDGAQARQHAKQVSPHPKHRQPQPEGREQRGPGREEAFPYAGWFDGQPHTLVRGEDFRSSIGTMRENLRCALRRYRYTAKIVQHGQTLTVTPEATPKQEAGAA